MACIWLEAIPVFSISQQVTGQLTNLVAEEVLSFAGSCFIRIKLLYYYIGTLQYNTKSTYFYFKPL